MTPGRKMRRIDSPQAAQQSPKSQPILYKVELRQSDSSATLVVVGYILQELLILSKNDRNRRTHGIEISEML
jgi:hypothetical protein